MDFDGVCLELASSYVPQVYKILIGKWDCQKINDCPCKSRGNLVGVS